MRLSHQQKMFALIGPKQTSQSTKDFCVAKGIGEASYYYWLKKYRQGVEQPAPAFVPVQIVSGSAAVVASIQMPGGAIISVYDVQVLSFMQAYL